MRKQINFSNHSNSEQTLFGLLSVSSTEMSELHSTGPLDLFREKNFQDIQFTIFLETKRNFFDILSEKLRRVGQNWNPRVQGNFLGHVLFCGKFPFGIFSGHWEENTWRFVMKISAGLSKVDSQFQRKRPWEKFLQNLYIIYKLLSLLNIEPKDFGWLSRNNPAEFSNYFLPVHEKIIKKKSFENFFIICGKFSDHFQSLSRKVLAGLSKLHSTYL